MVTVKETVIKVMTSDNKEVKIGDRVKFDAFGYVLNGKFAGIGSRGAYQFKGYGQFRDVEFNIAPRAIGSMYLVEDADVEPVLE